MAIKWIVMDMDGTLLNRQDIISDRTKQALMQCQKQGIRLILASGRSKFRLAPYVKELEMESYHGFLFEVNGLAITSLPSWNRDVFQRLETTQIEEVFDFIAPYEVEVQGYLDDTLYSYNPESVLAIKKSYREKHNLDQDYPWTGGAWDVVTDVRSGYPNIHYIEDKREFPKQLNKMCYVHSAECMSNLYPLVMERFQDELEIMRTCPRLLEITAKGITKGKTLKRFMEANTIKPDEVIAFGDGENDVEMFAQVQYSVAMGNAMEYVKDKARYLTSSNNDDGIAVFLRKMNVI